MMKNKSSWHPTKAIMSGEDDDDDDAKKGFFKKTEKNVQPVSDQTGILNKSRALIRMD